jgi:FkbM family methyltransferase
MDINNTSFIVLKYIYKHSGGSIRSLAAKVPYAIWLFRLIARQAITDYKGLILSEIQGHKMYINSDDIGFFILGEYEPEVSKVFLDSIDIGDTVIDIGAHIGYYTLLAARKVGPKGKVVAFEPEPNNFHLLSLNIKLNHYDNVIPIEKAVSNEESTVKLYLGGSSTNSVIKNYNISQNSNFITIKAINLDKFKGFGKIRLIKMDIEGAELLALKGMLELIDKNEDLIIISEFNPSLLSQSGYSTKEYISLLNDCGFKIKVIESNIILNLSNLDSVIDNIPEKSGVNIICSRKINDL